MSRVTKVVISATSALVLALTLGAATNAQAHWYYPSYYYGPHYYHNVVLQDRVVLNPIIVPSTVSVLFRANSVSPWTLYANYGAYSDAAGIASTLRGRGFETMIR